MESRVSYGPQVDRAIEAVKKALENVSEYFVGEQVTPLLIERYKRMIYEIMGTPDDFKIEVTSNPDNPNELVVTPKNLYSALRMAGYNVPLCVAKDLTEYETDQGTFGIGEDGEVYFQHNKPAELITIDFNITK